MGIREEVKQFPVHDWEWFGGVCGHCGRTTTFAVIARCEVIIEDDPYSSLKLPQSFAVCAGCRGFNVRISDGMDLVAAYPSLLPGHRVDGLPLDVEQAWQEARSALGAKAPVASEHMCRKILIHIAAGLPDAPKKMTFQQAVDSLVESRTITEPMKAWVDRIRLNGNEAAHELEEPDHARARLTLEFTEQLLRIVYEMKHRLEQLSRD